MFMACKRKSLSRLLLTVVDSSYKKDGTNMFHVRGHLKVARGDGTAGWLPGVVSDLKLSQPPPIAIVPLGAGNNFPFAFGWGKQNLGTNRHSVEAFLDQVLKEKEMKIDRSERKKGVERGKGEEDSSSVAAAAVHLHSTANAVHHQILRVVVASTWW